MIDHNEQFANLADKNKVSKTGIRNGENLDESDGDYYYDDATGYEPYESEADDEEDDDDNQSGS